MARQALFIALSDKAKNDQLYVLNDFKLETFKTKEVSGILANLKIKGTSLLVLPKNEPKTVKAARNIYNLSIIEANKLNAFDLLSVKNILLPKESIKTIEETFVNNMAAIFKKKEEIKKEAPKAEKKIVKKEVKVAKATKGFSFDVLKAPHVTEKASDLTEKNQYVFEVWPRTNKIEIKKAIHQLYGVDAIRVQIINIHSKERRVGRTIGTKKGYKKAIVTLKKGQKIEILPR